MKQRIVEEEKLWADVARGAMVSSVFCVVLIVLFLTIFSHANMILTLFLFASIFLEALILYLFLYRDDKKRVEIHWPYFYGGLLSGFVLIVFFLTFLSSISS